MSAHFPNPPKRLIKAYLTIDEVKSLDAVVIKYKKGSRCQVIREALEDYFEKLKKN